ncbi:MAG: Sec-independent protein translocase subunit TatA [Methylococcales bacterium]|nr:Sec-independent protein translocase subunit TatA [Methylococcales bacterium]
MGMSPVQLLIILAIVVVLFGTKRLRNLGSDLGGAIKGFRSSMKEGEEKDKITEEDDDNIIDGKVESESKKKVK